MYADTSTYSGPDENPMIDEDDELVFMARHLGDQKPGGAVFPAGTKPVKKLLNENYVLHLQLKLFQDFELELEIMDPLTGSTIGFLYIYENDGSLQQDANNRLVDYQFNLTKTDENGSNNYFDVYMHNCSMGAHGGEYECRDTESMNPEDTWFKSDFYERHFAENW